MDGDAREPQPAIDSSVPHSARIANYWLGGKDHYKVDQIAGERVRELFPQIVDVARSSRQFLIRVVRTRGLSMWGFGLADPFAAWRAGPAW